MRADMILLDRVAAQPSECKARQVKMESIPRGSFQRILHKEFNQGQQTEAPSADSSKPDILYADNQASPAPQDTAGNNLPLEEITAGVLTALEPGPEAFKPGKAESVAVFAPQEGLAAELAEGLMITATATAQSPQTVTFGQEIMEPSKGQNRAGWGAQLAQNQASNIAVQNAIPAAANSNSSIPWPEDAFTSVQLDAGNQGQTAARSAGEGTSSANLQSAPLLSITRITGEVPNPEEPQVKTDNQGQQTARELAELESRKLNGQKVSVIHPSTAAEHNQIGRESRSDYTYQAVRAEGPILKSPESNSLVIDKPASFPSNLDTQDVLNQIVRKADLMVRNSHSQMKIELYPEFLGKLTIKVMVEEGAVTARFITDNHQVKQMLEANLGMLRQSLESQGMRVERAEVDVQLNNGGLFDGSHEQREWNWDNRYFYTHAESKLKDQDVYLIAQELLPAESVPYEAFGIQPDGSLNFVI